MSTPETVAALALALTSLALLRALAQNGKGRGCGVPQDRTHRLARNRYVFWPNSGSDRGAGPPPRDKMRQPRSKLSPVPLLIPIHKVTCDGTFRLL